MISTPAASAYCSTHPVLSQVCNSQDILVASVLADHHSGVSARDLVHAAVMQRLGADHIISADTDFDRLEGIVRLNPARVMEWERSIPSVGTG